ncbi:peptidoglycan recognition protein family protein [Streptomyces auratus]|uniref:Peptidoglycan recognition protein n=1 Tax=Streptomyces auratus AGR0001 TaxID=1160718 RepID=J2JYF9_9ACTN|nr:peptidoglycan recognition protein [Streptomyces auratus]QTZ92276.1 peptidoglycan recognition protein [Streptomyces auratus AGR0001]
MRPFLATCLGALCTAALTLPLAATAGAGAAPAAPHPARTDDLPGSTQSLPVGALGAAAPHTPDRDTTTGPAPQELGLPPRTVRPFSLLGVVWDDAAAELHGRVQVRTRANGSGDWSGWQDVQVHNDDAPDLGSAERHGSDVRGSTAPLWVGDSDAVQLRITPEHSDRARAVLPGGLRLELVDPGASPRGLRGARLDPPAPLSAEAAAASAANAGFAPLGATEIPALDQAASQGDIAAVDGPRPEQTFVGPRPRIVTRAGWGADEKLREKAFTYTKTVRAAFVHHSGSGNNYSCEEAPSLIRAMYRFHVKSNHWRDIGYNFLVDKCGTVYEGRAGGIAKPVMGAHTLGFNTDSTGVAVLGTFTDTEPAKPAVDAIARLTAWKLGLYNVDPRAMAQLLSGGGNRFAKGTKVSLHVISGHRDGFTTDCPGTHLYDKLAATRRAAATLQGR